MKLRISGLGCTRDMARKITGVGREAPNGGFSQEDGECAKAIVNCFLSTEYLRAISTRIPIVLEQDWRIMMIVRIMIMSSVSRVHTP